MSERDLGKTQLNRESKGFDQQVVNPFFLVGTRYQVDLGYCENQTLSTM